MHQEITFDRFVRGLMIGGICIAVFLVINYLSNILLPFMLAWVFAYLLYPVVKFIERVTHIHVRAISIIISLILVLAVFAFVIYLIVPPMIEQCAKLGDYISYYVHKRTNIEMMPETLTGWITENQEDILKVLKSADLVGTVKTAAPKMYSIIGQTWNMIMSVIGSFITLLYMFFILMDYEVLSKKWIHIFPKKNRPFWRLLAKDVEHALNNYIRGQGLVALIMAILFCIGFTIIKFPMAIGLAVIIGILDMIPYLHTIALIPTFFLALFKSAETGQNFWIIFGSALAVFCIVQIIIDMVVTPKVMGKAMGLNPAVLLLSLSIWGAILGFIGLIIALPATTIIMAYWRRYVTHEETMTGTLIIDPSSENLAEQIGLTQHIHNKGESPKDK